ncbi:MAG: hypothetical protein WD176_01015, partial [Pirellulales bacterium]
LVDTPLQIVCFGLGHDGEMYLVDYFGTLHRLINNPVASANQQFPTRLSQTGLFASAKDHRVADGVIPYSINAQPWADGAKAERFAALPGDAKLGIYDKEDVQQGFIKGAWSFPSDGVLVKTLSLDVAPGSGRPPRRIETQILHMDVDTWKAYSYLWNDEQTDAELVPADGIEKTLNVADPQSPGGKRQQAWTVASRTQCILCHTTRAGSIHGFNVSQLNRDHDYGGATDNQLRVLDRIGLLEHSPEIKPPLADPYDESADLDRRARTWLHVNCAHCHRRGGGGSAFIDLRHDIALDKTNLLGSRPIQGTFGIHGAELIAAGQPNHSVLFYRVSKLGRGRMPYFGSSLIDDRGVALLRDWIVQLGKSSPPAKTNDSVVQLQARERQLIATLGAAPVSDEKRRAEVVTQLLASTSGALALLETMHGSALSAPAKTAAAKLGTTHADPQIRDLFERYVPEEQRVRRLGSAIKPAEILAI